MGQFCGAGASVPVVCADAGQSDDDEDPSTPCRADVGVAVQAAVTLEVDIESITEGSPERLQFEESFIADMAGILGIQSSRVQITSISGGSAVVDFVVLPAADGSSLPAADLEATFNDPENPVSISGYSASELSGVTTESFECVQLCPAGFQDVDCDNTTACAACAPGQHSAGGVSPAGLCGDCAIGYSDFDMDGATSCTACAPGSFAATEGQAGACTACPAGTFAPASGGDSLQACEQCDVGQYSPPRSSACAFCSSGRADEDEDASTECTICPSGTYAGCGETECTVCAPGEVDSDENAATPCTACLVGQYWEAPSGLNLSTCVQCPAGRADVDEDSTTSCMQCGGGFYAPAGGSECSNCSARALIDHDDDASTDCVLPGTVCVQRCGIGSGDEDCDISTVCQACEPGRFSEEMGVGGCQPCALGTYEPEAGRNNCSGICDQVAGLQCNAEGISIPLPASGFYMEDDKWSRVSVDDEDVWVQASTTMEQLVPPEACSPPEGCKGGHYGQDNCAAGYGGKRCSRCLHKSDLGHPALVSENGYYRSEGLCVKCGNPIPLPVLLVVGTIAFVLVALVVDRVLANVSDVSQLLAPILILMTFFQTLALLLKFSLPWPDGLKQLMTYMSALNFNLELARPECTVQWDASTKMDVILLTPFAMSTLIAMYGVSQWFLHHKDKHSNTLGLFYKCEAMGVGMLMLCSSFFLKGVFGGFDCTQDAGSGLEYLDIDPSVPCDQRNDTYNLIRWKARLGLLMWIVLMATFCRKFLSEGGKYRYAFLATKLEDEWYWWELLLLVRKIAIMMCGLFNTNATSRGWYLGSMVIIMSLAAHAFARPFKNELVDACEFVSLLSTLIIFQSGMVWETGGQLQDLGFILENVSVGLVLMVSAMGIASQIDAVISNAEQPNHFDERRIKNMSFSRAKKLCEDLYLQGDELQALLEKGGSANEPDEQDDKAQKTMEKLKKISDEVDALTGKSCVNSICSLWLGEQAASILRQMDRLQEKELLILLHLERDKADSASGSGTNKGIEQELKRRLACKLVSRAPPVVHLRENVDLAISATASLATQLASADEFEQAIQTLQSERDRFDEQDAMHWTLRNMVKHCLICRKNLNMPSLPGSQEASQKSKTYQNPMMGGSEEGDNHTQQNPLHKGESRLFSTLNRMESSLGIDIDGDGDVGVYENLSPTKTSADAAADDAADDTADDEALVDASELEQIALLKKQLDELEAQWRVDASKRTLTLGSLRRAADTSAHVYKRLVVKAVGDTVPRCWVDAIGGGEGESQASHLVLTSLTTGSSSAVEIISDRSGPNALALFGDVLHEEADEQDQQLHKHGKQERTTMPGRCVGTSFTPYDFSKSEEELVVRIDGRSDHTVYLTTNIPDLDAALRAFRNEMWIQRGANETDVKTTVVMVKSLSRQLVEHDPVGKTDYSHYKQRHQTFGCVQHKLPRALRTTPATRRQRRFDAAMEVVTKMQQHRFIVRAAAGSAEEQLELAAAVQFGRVQQQLHQMGEAAEIRDQMDVRHPFEDVEDMEDAMAEGFDPSDLEIEGLD